MIAIPYVSAARPSTGLTNGRLGIWLFLASEVMLFGALFSSYLLLRAAAPSWPAPGTLLALPLATVNTLVLLASSLTFAASTRELARGEAARGRGWLLATTVLGLVFLAIKSFEYRSKLAHGMVPATGMPLAIYYTLTGVHALHVAAGVLANGWLAGPGAALRRSDPEHYRQRVEVAGIYWHFVDLVWVVLFASLYLV